MRELALLVLAAIFGVISGHAAPSQRPDIVITAYGAKGDGVTDDTVSVQKALSYCSNSGATCKIPADKAFLITRPLFLWGHSNLRGEDGSGALVFNVASAPYLLNIGISGKNKAAAPFSGEISHVLFKTIGGPGGRIIYFWRTDGATIKMNAFIVDQYAYSATSSGNDNRWLINGFANCVRKDVRIIGNKISASGKELGSEGIGLGNFDGAIISNNEIVGVGDDPVGIHFSKHILINNNQIKSVDGRVFIANSSDVEISHNHIERMSSLSGMKFYVGIALIYVGVETLADNSFAAPSGVLIRDNFLQYPAGAVDQGAAINLNGVRKTSVEHNRIRNDSRLVTATALHLSPVIYSGNWADPASVESSKIGSVGDVDIRSNISDGKYPLKMLMTGNCNAYRGTVTVRDNVAQDFDFYCGKVFLSNNRRIAAAE